MNLVDCILPASFILLCALYSWKLLITVIGYLDAGSFLVGRQDTSQVVWVPFTSQQEDPSVAVVLSVTGQCAQVSGDPPLGSPLPPSQ